VKAPSTVRRHLKGLRDIVETSKDPIEIRIAYAMEQAVRWAVEDTSGWPSLADEARANTQILRNELKPR
jgi:hypothetical protein